MERILKFFAYDHLREDLKGVSRPFAELAQQVVGLVPAGPERTVSLRKLLEAKDTAVRAVRHSRMRFARTFECDEPVPIRARPDFNLVLGVDGEYSLLSAWPLPHARLRAPGVRGRAGGLEALRRPACGL